VSRRLLLGILTVCILGALGCPAPGSSSGEGGRAKDCSALTPRNPYAEGGGHFAGFEWAGQNAGSGCDGNSDSFNNGCLEYHRQSAAYAACVSKQ